MTWRIIIGHDEALFFSNRNGRLSVVVRWADRAKVVRYTPKFDAIAWLGPLTTEGRVLTVQEICR